MSVGVPSPATESTAASQTVSPVVAEPDPHVDEPSAEHALAPAAPLPADSPRSAGSDTRGGRPNTAAYLRALAGRAPAIQACASVAAGGLAELTVEVDIETSGRISPRRPAQGSSEPMCRRSAAKHIPRRSLHAGFPRTHLHAAADAATTVTTVTTMNLSFVLALILAPAPEPTVLPPTAAEHNDRAMVFYDSGQLALAFEEFHAAYTAMPDARADRAGRESLLGSMRATLLQMHAATGESAPLCRLAVILQAHADALAAVHPESPDMLEIRSARARHDEVTAQLAALGPDKCVPSALQTPPAAPVPTVSSVPAPVVTPPPPPRPADPIPPRHLRIAGGVTLGLGAALLGVMTFGITGEARHERRVDEIDAGAAGRPFTLDEHDELQGHRSAARSARALAIGTGVVAGMTAALGTTMFVLARRSARTPRWSAAPWWSPAGGGLTLRVQLGASY
jgi:hypothetical protein